MMAFVYNALASGLLLRVKREACVLDVTIPVAVCMWNVVSWVQMGAPTLVEQS